MDAERPTPTAELVRRWVAAGEREEQAKRAANAAQAAQKLATNERCDAERAVYERFVAEGHVADGAANSEAHAGVRWNGSAIIAEGGRVRRITLETAGV